MLLIHMSATEKPLACPRQKEGDCLSHPAMKLIPPLAACRFPLPSSSMLLLSVILARWRSCHDLTKMHQNLRVVFGFSVLQLVSV